MGELGDIDHTHFSEFLLQHDAFSSHQPKRYRIHTNLQHNYPKHTSAIRWNSFWRTNMKHTARNILFRMYHSTIPTGNLLNRINPSFLTSSHCRICQHPTETLNHFLIWRPKKKQIWPVVQQQLFHTHPPLFAILQTITKNAIVQQQLPSNKFLQICSYILLYIWRAHWATVFNENPFVPQHMATTAINAITTHVQL